MSYIKSGPQPPVQPGTKPEQRLVDAVRRIDKTVVFVGKDFDRTVERSEAMHHDDYTSEKLLGHVTVTELVDKIVDTECRDTNRGSDAP